MLVASCLENDHFAVPERSSRTSATTITSKQSITLKALETLLADIELYDRICAGDDTVLESQNSIEARLDQAIPILIDLGVFEVFKPEQWLIGESMGKKFIGISAKLLGC